MSGDADVRRMIRRIRQIPGLAKRAAPACAQALDATIGAKLASGASPDGEGWAPKKDGGRPLANAAQNATITRAVGTTIVTTTRGHYWVHNRGTQSLPRRRVIPTKLTPELAEPIRRSLVEAFDREVRRG